MKGKRLAFVALILLTLSHKGFCQNKDEHNMRSARKLTSLHDSTQSLSVQILFKGVEGKAMTLQINKNGILPEHLTKTDAVLICISGKVSFENEKKEKYIIKAGEYFLIAHNIQHWVTGIEDSQLILLK